MPLFRRAVLASGAVILALTAWVSGGEAPRATAQLPIPNTGLTITASVATDGHGVVLTWSINNAGINAASLVVFRLYGSSSTNPGVPILLVRPGIRAYTDYDVTVAGGYCYRIASAPGGTIVVASFPDCLNFAPGRSGTARPIIAPGCSRYYQTHAPSSSMTDVAAAFEPASAVVSLWRYDSGQQRVLAGYFNDPNTPTDFTTLPASQEFEYACLSASATFH
jgi:hypothetical protein